MTEASTLISKLLPRIIEYMIMFHSSFPIFFAKKTRNKSQSRIKFKKSCNFVVCRVNLNISLVIFNPSHLNGTFTEYLSLHINSVFPNEPHSTLTPTHSTLTGTFPVILWMSCIQLVRDTCLSHCYIYGQAQKKRKRGDGSFREKQNKIVSTL